MFYVQGVLMMKFIIQYMILSIPWYTISQPLALSLAFRPDEKEINKSVFDISLGK